MTQTPKKKILCVDDDSALGLTFARCLEDSYDVTFVETVENAKAALRQNKYDAIISDYELAPGDGFDVLRAARMSDSNSTTPFVLLSGNLEEARNNNVYNVLKSSIAAELSKPFDKNVVIDALSRILDKPSPPIMLGGSSPSGTPISGRTQ